MRAAFIYLVQNKRTTDRYVGQCVGNVARRWAGHVTDIMTLSAPYQDFDGDLTEWAFSILEVLGAASQDDVDEREMYWIDMLQPELNTVRADNTTFAKGSKREEVKRLLTEGMKYRDIGALLGISLGSIANIKKDMEIDREILGSTPIVVAPASSSPALNGFN